MIFKMKKLVLVMCALAIGCGVNAQKLKETDVPAHVRAKFSSLYPEVKDVKWEKENGQYEAEMGQDKSEISVLFDANGNLLQTETEMPVTDLPQGVRDYSSLNLKGKNIKEATRIVDAAGMVTYEAEIGNQDYIFDTGGKFIKNDSDDGDKEDDDDDKK
jgi:hypothetical protein